MPRYALVLVCVWVAGCYDTRGTEALPRRQPRRSSTPAAESESVARRGAEDAVAGRAAATSSFCAATCASPYVSVHRFEDPADVSAIVGRWLVCNQPSIAPLDQAGIEFTSDGHLIILRRGPNGEIVRGSGDDARARYESHGAALGGGFELIVRSAPYNTLDGQLYDCPKRLKLRDLFGNADGLRPTEYVFDTGIDPGFCQDDRPTGCNACGNATCPAGARLNSACQCQAEVGRTVRPLSQPCNACCGKTCGPDGFLDFACQCYSP